jgi:hypothetical protein
MYDDFKTELSDELQQMASPENFQRWINDGRARMGYYVGGTASLTWIIGDWTVNLPTDFCDADSIEPADGVRLPPFRVWERQLRFNEKATTAGSATLFYLKLPAEITGVADSTLPDVLDQGLVSYALFRFFKWLATSRADYRRYSTIAQGNAADVPQLLAAGAGHRQDFAEAVDTHSLNKAVSFFGEV